MRCGLANGRFNCRSDDYCLDVYLWRFIMEGAYQRFPSPAAGVWAFDRRPGLMPMNRKAAYRQSLRFERDGGEPQ